VRAGTENNESTNQFAVFVPDQTLKVDFFGLAMTDAPTGAVTNDEGLGYSRFFTNQSAAPLGQTLVDTESIDWVLNVTGIQDDGLGTLSGLANRTLQQPQHIAELLFSNWDGASWQLGDFDQTINSATHIVFSDINNPFYRIINGRAEGRVTVQRLLSDVCKNSLSRIVRVSSASNRVGLYAWGDADSPSLIFSDDDARMIRYTSGGLESVINVATMLHRPTLSTEEFIDVIGQGGQAGYASYTELTPNDGGLGQELAADSLTLFGRRELADNVYTLVGDDFDSTTDPSAENVLEGILRQGTLPSEFVDYEVLNRDYPGIAPMQLGKIRFPELPSAGGSSVRPFGPVYDGRLVQISDLDTLSRYREFRAQIYNINYALTDGGPFRMRIRARLLTNPDDPTGNPFFVYPAP
jgi:hypothetical protein